MKYESQIDLLCQVQAQLSDSLKIAEANERDAIKTQQYREADIANEQAETLEYAISRTKDSISMLLGLGVRLQKIHDGWDVAETIEKP